MEKAREPRSGGAKQILEWVGSEHELLANEKEVLGFYLSGHPLARFQTELNLFFLPIG